MLSERRKTPESHSESRFCYAEYMFGAVFSPKGMMYVTSDPDPGASFLWGVACMDRPEDRRKPGERCSSW